ncbi:hypothetical protein [Roseovarius sp. SYSU LYC5161]|uniref:hypothetical protein n=1 Tax=Roseovarius halophilus (ex Wu et al. 2025) TaxID=3376060 RepID=UPI002871D25F|nr:hypothetical protein [Roseovarius sp.]
MMTKIIAETLAEPAGYHGVETAFRTWRNSLHGRAKPYSLHGLRKPVIIELSWSGAPGAGLLAVTGQSAQMVA